MYSVYSSAKTIFTVHLTAKKLLSKMYMQLFIYLIVLLYHSLKTAFSSLL